MKRFMTIASLALLMASPAMAQDGDRPRGERGTPDPERMQRMLDRFDKDGDGELSREERAAMWRGRGEGRRPEGRGGEAARGPREGDRPRGPRDGDRARGPREGNNDKERDERAEGGERGDRGPREGRGGGPGFGGPGRGGPPQGFGRGGRPGGFPTPEAIFDRLDKDGDGQLSKEEFTAFGRGMGQGRPGGPGFGGPGRGGPPEGRGGFGEGRGPGRGPGDREGRGGPRAERGDGDRDNEGGESRRGGNRGGRGPQGRPAPDNSDEKT